MKQPNPYAPYYLDPGDALRLARNGYYEGQTTLVLKKELRPGEIFVDVGAHIGYYTLLAGSLAGERGAVYAFEPEPGLYSLLTKNVTHARIASTFSLFNLGLSDCAGRAQFYCGANSGDTRLWGVGPPAGEVEVSTLDSFFPHRLRRQPLFLKIDTQGYECKILRGGRRFLQEGPVRMVIEFWPHGLRGAGDDPGLLPDLLAELGFSWREIDREKGLQGIDTAAALVARYSCGQRHVNLYCVRE